MPEEIKEKKELLKREEIKTMEKDLLKLREEEARKEREKIIGLKIEEEKEEKLAEKPLTPTEPSKKILPSVLTRPISRKPSSSEKIFIRVASIVIPLLFLALVFTSWYWYSKEMEKISLPFIATPTPIVTPTPTETITPTPGVTPEGTPGVTPEVTGTPVPTPVLSITDRILTWGYYTPKTPRLIDSIIIHSAYNALGGDLHDVEKVIQEFKMYKVTSHYLIARDGTIYRLAPNEAIAYHAGAGKMPDGTRKNIINNFSIGIELIYTKDESPNEVQYQSLSQLVKSLQQKYNIPLTNILGHKDISTTGKTDPWNFDWEKFNQMSK